MSAESDEILARCRRVRNIGKDGEMVQKAVRFMTETEKEAKQEDLALTESILSPQNQLPGHVLLTQDARKNLIGYMRFLKKDLAENCPPTDLSPETRNILLAEERKLREHLEPTLQPEEVMRRNPTGAVSDYVKWRSKEQDNVLIWKNIRRVNNIGDTSEDVANIETLRRPMCGPQGSAPTFMADAQIPGVFAQSALSKQNYPETFGHEYAENSPLAQAERRELEELRAEKTKREEVTRERQRRYGTSEEARARQAKRSEEMSKRVREKWAAKKAAGLVGRITKNEPSTEL